MKNQTFHIIGGGIAGLASAIAVANSGNKAIVLEKAPKFEDVGAGLQLGPNAARALQKLGVWDTVKPITSSPPEIHIRNGKTGELLTRITLGKTFESRFGMPYRVAHRADLLQALLQAARTKSEITICNNADVTDFSAFENVIAADGVWSKTREALFPSTAAIVTRDIFHRALVKNDKGLANECVNLWLYPGGHVVHYPVGHPAKLNLVAITQNSSPLAHFAGACDELKQILALPEQWQQWPAAYVPELLHWNRDNVTLLGDAAHGTLPYLAQGAAMALEDAAELGVLLSMHEDAKSVFKSLVGRRRSRTTQLHRATLQSGKIYHAKGIIAALRDTALRFGPPQLLNQRLAWIYNDGGSANAHDRSPSES
jgi:salicylate hydroxylase